jgi:hypothetical protein
MASLTCPDPAVAAAAAIPNRDRRALKIIVVATGVAELP